MGFHISYSYVIIIVGSARLISFSLQSDNSLKHLCLSINWLAIFVLIYNQSSKQLNDNFKAWKTQVT
jgi:hypothetical protein